MRRIKGRNDYDKNDQNSDRKVIFLCMDFRLDVPVCMERKNPFYTIIHMTKGRTQKVDHYIQDI